jgi:8-oxo-dGTP pyrophosphatase MutT (NUDIX family)
VASRAPESTVRREHAVAVFVVHDGAVLLHYHQKLARWLPPGGHVDPDELPHVAAIRETREEVGLEIEVVDAVNADYRDVDRPAGVPSRLPSPIGMQLEDIPARPGNLAHQHIDFIYAATVVRGSTTQPTDVEGGAQPRWTAPSDWRSLGVTPEVVTWAESALRIVESGRERGVPANL